MVSRRIEQLGPKFSIISRALLVAFGIGWIILAEAQIFQKEIYFSSDSSKLEEVLHFTVDDTVLQGSYENFHLNGSLKTFGHYQGGLPDSTWTYYYENGRKRAEGEYEAGRTFGYWTYYYENGEKKSEGVLIDGVKNGGWTFFYENGNPKSSGTYQANIKQGIWTYFFEDERTRAQAYYEDGSGIYKEFYPSGAVRMEGMNKNEKSDGKWTYYFESGEIEAEGFFRDGLRIGDWVYYYKSGNPRAVGMFSQGEETGIWKYFHEQGTLKAQGEMKEGEREGFWKLYYPSGELRGEGQYEDGDGLYVEYYPSGKRKAEGQMKAGKKHGHWIYYNEEGIVEGEADYELGMGVYRGFYADGTIKTSGALDNDKRVGEWKLFHPDGSLAGTHLSVYEEDKPIFKSRQSESKILDERNPVDKPEYLAKKERWRYFRPRINEYNGYIIATNPFASLLDSWPVSVEYYQQERLGYELQFHLRRDPFWTADKNVSRNTRYSRGATLVFRQKFYNSDNKYGLFYFGHQVGYGVINHFERATDQLFLNEEVVRLTEDHLYYGLFVGNRWMRNAGNAGWTIDVYVGIGAGYRSFRRQYEGNEYDNRYNDLLDNNGYFPLIFGLNFGWTGPKRSTTSQL